MMDVVLLVGGEDEDIIEVDNDIHIQDVVEDIIHIALKHSG
jgi:hypothetical protein